MANLNDYLYWRGDLSFDEAPFNPVDAMVLCELSYYNFDGVIPAAFSEGSVALGDACKKNVLDPLPVYCTEDDLELCGLITKSRRFSEISASGFLNRIDEEQDMQFCAVTFLLKKKLAFVAFRGTDDSLVGWKENMDLAYNEVVPSQTEAVKYLRAAARATRGPLMVGGHSKGGNLAVYGAAFSGKRVNRRIAAVFNFDGPGFNEKVIQQQPFTEIAERTHTFVPQNSLVGLLLEHKEPYSVAHSNASNGISQHHMFSWEVARDDIVRDKELTKSGENNRENIREWIASMSDEEKRAFIDVIYQLIEEYKTTGELFSVRNIWNILKDYRSLPEENKKAVTGAMGELKNTMIANLKERFANKSKERAEKKAEKEEAPDGPEKKVGKQKGQGDPENR